MNKCNHLIGIYKEWGQDDIEYLYINDSQEHKDYMSSDESEDYYKDFFNCCPRCGEKLN